MIKMVTKKFGFRLDRMTWFEDTRIVLEIKNFKNSGKSKASDDATHPIKEQR